jgi:hypothetical protein
MKVSGIDVSVSLEHPYGKDDLISADVRENHIKQKYVKISNSRFIKIRNKCGMPGYEFLYTISRSIVFHSDEV